MLETPPRAWRRLHLRTCPDSLSRKHLHVRGEDNCTYGSLIAVAETPPRAWRRLMLAAEAGIPKLKHLHVRGEDSVLSPNTVPA